QATGNTDVVATNGAGFGGSDLNHSELDMTPDGRFISYVASVGSTTAIYQWDALNSRSNLVSGTYANNTVPSGSVCLWPVMDSTGRYVAFLASASGLTTNGDTGYHIYQRDMQAGVTQLVDANSNGIPSSGGSIVTIPHMSADGSLIAFALPDATLVSGDNNR